MKALFKKIVVTILMFEARLILAKYKPKIIAVTGNVGKTSTKDAIYTALKSQLQIRKNKKSLNSETGVPLTILGEESGWNNPFKWIRIFSTGLSLILFTKKYPEWLVLEVGTDQPGDIQAIAKWLHPDVIVLTALPSTPVHLSNFDSIKDMLQEKLSLLRSLKQNGILILNGDDEKVCNIAQEFSQQKFFYTRNPTGKIIYTKGIPTGMEYYVPTKSGDMRIFLHGIIGTQWAYLPSVALTVSEALHLDTHRATLALQNYDAPPSRMRILDGIGETTIIDDSYNSSPLALKAALDTLNELKCEGRKIVVLGDMRELGEHSIREHKIAGKHVAQIADILITIGEESKVLATAATEAGMPAEQITQFGYYDSAKAGQKVRGMLQKGDVVLVKGSQNKIRTERVVKAIMQNPNQASELIVRQEREWLDKM